ncbi:hypothetical protein D5S18_29600 [Nocardia panacis]|uniref:Uncharacterized protein n=1 Tax=Nocardia panacis TaxID=2340916 RepID=A0A3A4KL63_9NOCA|nr:hypothetical protein [Nocardia panacis]RJO70019.1 hypothetical protein D5S18_29600 [Nocardia panacis]
MMPVARDPVGDGLELARTRLVRYDVAFSEEAIEQTLAGANELLRSGPAVPDRATELTIEMVAIAATMRIHYGEPELSFNELASFVDVFRRFMNSWWHE